MSSPSTTLVERIGGEPPIMSAKTLFYEKVVATPELERFLEHTRDACWIPKHPHDGHDGPRLQNPAFDQFTVTMASAAKIYE